MNKVRNIEHLSADMLNDDFIRIFQPVFFALRFLGFLRVNIKYRFPTAPSTWYHFYSNIFWIFNTFCVVYFFLRCESGFGSPYADSCLKLGAIMNGINGVLLVFRNNLQRGNKVGQMYVKLQKIERYLNMKNSTSLNKQLERQSTLTIVSACSLTILCLILYKIFLIKNMCIPLMVIMTTGAGLHIEMVEVYLIIQLIATRVNYINEVLRRDTSRGKDPIDKSTNDGNLFYVINPSENPEDEVPSELVSAMHCVFEVLADFTELFQLSVILIYLQFFTSFFLTIITHMNILFHSQLFYFVCQILVYNLVAIHYLVSSLKEQVRHNK